MEDFEVTVESEVIRVSESLGDDGFSYTFAWLNGPDDGTYGWTVGRFSSPPSRSYSALAMTRSEILSEIEGFISGFYAPGGIGETDFPLHRPAAR